MTTESAQSSCRRAREAIAAVVLQTSRRATITRRLHSSHPKRQRGKESGVPWLFRRKQPRSSTDLQALTQQMGLPGTSAAIGRPADFFANDWSASRPANPTVISVNAYGPMLDHALAVGDAINSLGPEELDTLHAATQALASVRPSEAHFVPVHHATVDYLESRLAQAVADGRYTAAIFNSNHRNLVDHLRQEK